jgi:parallel beta-helix repeat protein
MLSVATSNCIENNTIKESARSAIELYKSGQNRLLNNAISMGAKDGISLSDSQENAISHNSVKECSGTGILLGSAISNLVLDNKITGNAIGIQGVEAVRNRILRNELSGNLLAGLVLSEGEDNLLLDNTFSDGAYGVALIDSKKNEMLRNHLKQISAEGISLLNRADKNLIKDNIIGKANIAILVAASSGNTIVDNYLSLSKTAVNLFEPGAGTRLEGNDIVNNSIGIQLISKLEADDTILRGSGSELVTGDKDFQLTITNNAFASNKLYDISNQTDHTLYIGQNNWEHEPGESKGRVSAGVGMPDSTWRGTVAIGTTDSIAHIIIGRLLQIGLSANKIKVIDLIGLGNEDTVQEAMTAGDIDLALVNPNSVNTDTPSANGIVVSSLPAVENKVTLVVSEGLAAKLGGNTITDLAKWLEAEESPLEVVVEKDITEDQVELLSSQYGIELSTSSINWTDGIDETETKLKLGSGNAGMVYGIEETLTMMGFEALEDDKDVLPASHIAIQVSEELLNNLPEIEFVEQQLGLTLTTANVHSLVSKVRLLHSDPIETARQFMLRNELIAQ